MTIGHPMASITQATLFYCSVEEGAADCVIDSNSD